MLDTQRMNMKRAYIIVSLALFAMLSACGGGDDTSSNCANYSTQAAAQAAYRNGQTQLDGDGDGKACEHLK